MTTIYCLTDFEQIYNSKFFMTLEGVAKWLIERSPIDNQIKVRDPEIAGSYDITADNLRTILTAAQRNRWTASFTIQQDFVLDIIETQFFLSTIDVED